MLKYYLIYIVERNDTVYSNFNWKDCYKYCKEQGLYLHGDYDVMDPISACHGIQTGNGYTWVGIARQHFTLFSLGTYEKNQLLACMVLPL